MSLRWDLEEYIAMTAMSSKARILVEGKGDRGHISSLFAVLHPEIKVRIDLAIDIKGNCKTTSSNNRAKIEKIHDFCKSRPTHKKLFFLCDREFRKFELGEQIIDELKGHEVDGNLSFTLGHSIENYFLSDVMLGEGFKFLTASGLKTEAVEIFCDFFDSSIRIVAAASLAAKILCCAGYPAKLVTLDVIKVSEGGVEICWGDDSSDDFMRRFVEKYEECLEIVNATETLVCARFCRGHTAVIILQRVFAACLLHAGNSKDKEQAEYDAALFANVSENSISSALSESWIRRVSTGEASYPLSLVDLVQMSA